jgi:hypothetical protein
MFNPGEKVRSELGAEGVVERVLRNKDGQTVVHIRWSRGPVGAYTLEEIKRYGIRRVPS